MRADPLLRLVGGLIYGFIGYEVALVLGNTIFLDWPRAMLLAGGAITGMVLGILFARWLVYAPARGLNELLGGVATIDLVAGAIGLSAGLLIAALLALPLSRFPDPLGSVLPLVTAVILGYLGAAVMLMRREEVLGLLRMGGKNKDGRGSQSGETKLLLDSSVIIDGRIADVARTGFLIGKLIVPRFVLNEVQYIADSADALRRNRGRRGLEILDRLQNVPDVAIEFVDTDVPGVNQVDDKLVALALQLDALILTNDFNLNKVARLQGVRILNVNELANAVKSVLLPGEEMAIRVIQEGKEIGQGVGYLDDGTMVVIENGRRFLNQEIAVQVTKVLQTNAGRLIFASPQALQA